MKEENKKLESQNLNFKKKINIKNEEIKSSQSNFDILFSKFEGLEKLNENVIEKNNKLENEIQTLKSNNNELKNEIQTLRLQSNNYEIQIQNLQTEITLLLSEKNSSFEQIKKIKEENDELAKNNEELKIYFF